MPKFSSMENICFYAQYTMLLHDTSNLGQQGLKTRRSTQGCAYCGVNNVPLNFGSQTSKNKFWDGCVLRDSHVLAKFGEKSAVRKLTKCHLVQTKKTQVCGTTADCTKILWTSSPLDQCMCTKFGADRLWFAGDIPKQCKIYFWTPKVIGSWRFSLVVIRWSRST